MGHVQRVGVVGRYHSDVDAMSDLLQTVEYVCHCLREPHVERVRYHGDNLRTNRRRHNGESNHSKICKRWAGTLTSTVLKRYSCEGVELKSDLTRTWQLLVMILKLGSKIFKSMFDVKFDPSCAMNLLMRDHSMRSCTRGESFESFDRFIAMRPRF